MVTVGISLVDFCVEYVEWKSELMHTLVCNETNKQTKPHYILIMFTCRSQA